MHKISIISKFNPKTFKRLAEISLSHAENYLSCLSVIKTIEDEINCPSNVEQIETETLQYLSKTLMYIKNFVKEIDQAVSENQNEIEINCIFDYV